MGYYPVLDRAPKGRDEGDGGSSGSAATTSTTASKSHDLPLKERLGAARSDRAC